MNIQNPNINKTILNNGLTIVSEHISSYNSVAIGVWIKSGNRDETAENTGVAHFIEHMLFKGTPKRDAYTIASSIEQLGGNINAFTAKEETCFHIHLRDIHLKSGIEILGDIICNSQFDNNEIKLEKQVILEEITSVKDTPEELIFDILHEQMFPKQSFGRPILGTEESVLSFNRQILTEFYKNNYCPENIVIAVAGNVNHNDLINYVDRYFTFSYSGVKSNSEMVLSHAAVHYEISEPFNQAHICVGNMAVSCFDNKRYDYIALNTYLGEGLSSHLFQTLREKYGLVYSVYSFLDFYKDTGVLGVYLATDIKNKENAIDRLFAEFKSIIQNKMGQSTVDKIKEQIKGGLYLALESTTRRMMRLAKNEIIFNKYISLDEVSLNINKITPDSIMDAAQNCLQADTLSKVIISPEKHYA